MQNKNHAQAHSFEAVKLRVAFINSVFLFIYSFSGLGATLLAALQMSACADSIAIKNQVHQKSAGQWVQSPLFTERSAWLKKQGAKEKDIEFDGGLSLIGVKLSEKSKAGDVVKGQLFWQLTKTLSSTPKVFMHGQVAGAKLNQTQGDHLLLGGALDLQALPAGDVLVDDFQLKIPKNFSANAIEIRVGLYEGKARWPIQKGAHDADQRVLIATLLLPEGGPVLPRVEVQRLQTVLTVDGKLLEPQWQQAQKIGPFISWDGKTHLRNSTYARLLYDDEYLYIAFECKDADIHTPYTKRDDPLYNSEAVEIFIDADGDQDVYVELQAAPNDLQFDAAFKGGARKNFDTSYNAEYETKTSLNGSLNNEKDLDKGWISEWKIRISSLKDIPRSPHAGDQWKINLFRLDRIRRNGKVVRNEASAWSSPYSGDFHNLKRFGTLVFK